MGAFLSAYWSDTNLWLGSSPSPLETSGSLETTKWWAFMSGLTAILGGRVADGCTSGHGISGFSQLYVHSFVAVVMMFVGGIVTANLFRFFGFYGAAF